MARTLLVSLLLPLLFGACATVEVREEPRPLLRDEAFAAPSTSVDVDDVFALSPAMQSYLDGELGDRLRRRGKQRGLLSALQEQGQLRLIYDSAGTRNAAETFEGRSGNCLSLVIMTAAFAKAMGLNVTYHSVDVDETWSRQGGIYFHIGHVNLTLGQGIATVRYGSLEPNHEMTIDFLPPGETRGYPTIDIREERIVAMYLNNRAAEALASGRVDDAYWWARAAVLKDPGFLSSFNTLGVIYRRQGLLADAERAFRAVLAHDPENRNTLSNLQIVLQGEGRKAEATEVSRRLVALDPNPPFAFFERGMAALQAQDYEAARGWFEKEVARARDYHEFHFWLAVTLVHLGRVDEARRHLRVAIDNSTSHQDTQLYAAKLAHLQGTSTRQ
jgi:tetratricopeptide (TPR) repeat protein